MVTVHCFFLCVFLALDLNHVFYPEMTFEGIRGHFFVTLVKVLLYTSIVLFMYIYFFNENIQYYVRFTMLITVIEIQ